MDRKASLRRPTLDGRSGVGLILDWHNGNRVWLKVVSVTAAFQNLFRERVNIIEKDSVELTIPGYVGFSLMSFMVHLKNANVDVLRQFFALSLPSIS